MTHTTRSVHTGETCPECQATLWVSRDGEEVCVTCRPGVLVPEVIISGNGITYHNDPQTGKLLRTTKGGLEL